MAKSIAKKWEDLWFRPIDSRSYALIRISFSLACFLNFLTLWPKRHVFFSDVGMIDHRLLLLSDSISVFRWVHSDTGVTLIFVVAGLSILCLAIGFLTHLAALTNWYWIISYQQLASPACGGFDLVLALFAFLIAISPIHQAWTIDSHMFLKKDHRARKYQAPAYGLMLIRWQLLVIYLGTALYKLPVPIWRNGSLFSIYMLCMHSSYRFPIFAVSQDWSAFFTYGALLSELSLPFLLLIKKSRYVGLALGFLFHVFIAFTSNIWVFSTVMLSVYFAFIEVEDLERLAKYFFKRLPQRVNKS